jgi:hypothetical protein
MPGRVTLRFRPMNQALPVSAIEMEREAERFVARIAGAVLDGRYPLAYAFVVQDRRGIVRRFPGLGQDLAGVPYLVVRPEPVPDAATRTA